MISDFNRYEMNVIVGDKTLKEYISPINKQTFIEGRHNNNFKLRLINRTYNRILAVPSIDGLSVINGKPAGSESPGFILSPWQVHDISGWIVNDNIAASFCFNNVPSSYNQQSSNDINNVGVIGCMFFEELVEPVIQKTNYLPGMWFNHVAKPVVNNSVYSCDISTVNCTQFYNSVISVPQSALKSDLGTKFGEPVQYNTHQTHFKKKSTLPAAMLALYYGSVNFLQKFGIDIREPVPYLTAQPFPGFGGCVPPPNWNYSI